MSTSSSSEEETVIVLDNGSHRIKAGYGGDKTPRSVFRTVVGKNRVQNADDGMKTHYVGDEAMQYIDVLDVTRPIERGIITNWDDMEKIWQHTFDDLHVVPLEHPVIVTEPPLNPKANKERIVQMMFEKFHTPAMQLFCSNVLSLYASGRTTGVVVDSGYELTHVMCIYEGHAIPQSVFRLEIGGNDITNYLIDLLGNQGYVFTTMKEREEVSKMKEECAYVSLDPEVEQVHVDKIKKDYTFFNGKTITLGYERFQCQEVLFKPNLIGLDAPGIHELILQSIQACPVDIRASLYYTIILAGGNTMPRGLCDRIQKEIFAVVTPPAGVKVIGPPERRSSTWIGGSIVGSLSIQDTWLTKYEYDEIGPNVVHEYRLRL